MPASPVLAARKRAEAGTLPVLRLRLYETGVGYFERRGKVSAGSARVPLPASHLDDALKSLVILNDDGDARVAGVSFPSAVSQGMARALAGLPPAEDAEAIDHRTLLRSLIGLSVEGRTTDGSVRGRVLEVLGPFERPRKDTETKDDADEDAAPPSPPLYAVLLVTDAGRVRRISTDDLLEIGPRDPGQVHRLQSAATALSENAARRTESLRVELARGGSITVGYVAETPVWRTSYRVVLPRSGSRATLQAWALVHNDTDEDWDDVALEFVNGEPASFLYPLAAPRYERRELREPDRPLSTVPQLARHTVDSMYGDLDGGTIGEAYGVGGLGLVGTGRGGGGTGEGTIGLGHTGTIGYGGGGGDLARYSQAETEPAGALFSYRLADPVDLPAHSSALVPLVQSDIETETITLVPPRESTGATAARVVNDTDQTLPAGTVAFFHRNGFAGEAQLPRLKPTERAFVTYGRELDVNVTRVSGERGVRTVAVEYHHDRLYERQEVTQKLSVEVENRDGAPRRVYVGLPVPRRAEVTGAPELDYDHGSGTAMMVVTVPGRETVSHDLQVEHGDLQTYEPAKIEAALLRRLARIATLPEDTRTVLTRATDLRTEMDDNQAEQARIEHRVQRAKDDLGRLRDNVSALGDARSTDRAARRLARRVVETEQAVTRYQVRLDTLKRRHERLGERLRLTFAELSPEPG